MSPVSWTRRNQAVSRADRVRANLTAWAAAAWLLAGFGAPSANAQSLREWLAPTNLVAWCIVPFDTRHRTPEQRAEMLEKLGFSQLAYDWRSEHIPTFDAEVTALQSRHIFLRAWWFPAALNDEARAILNCIERRQIHPELWVMMGDPAPNGDQQAKIAAAVEALRPVVREAGRLGCKVGLYNHGGWFGEPENQLAIIEALNASNVGMVYNLHHGHDHLGRLPDILREIRPRLMAVNLNGMVAQGDRVEKKIVPFGQGDDDLKVLREIRDSGYRGPLGILGHTDEDAEAKLSKDLAGFSRLSAALLAEDISAGTPKISGHDPGVQGESDWVDNRWQQTDIGPMLACNLSLPGGTIAKGLAIKAGQENDAAVAYDTDSLSFRAAWQGGFLRLDPRRFGLIGAPSPFGTNLWVFPPGEGWPGARRHFNGLHLNGNRVVLDFAIDNVTVLESPKFIPGKDPIWIRTLNIGPGENEVRFVAAGIPSAHGGIQWTIEQQSHFTTANVSANSRRYSVLVAGSNVALKDQGDGRVIGVLPPSKASRSLNIFLSDCPGDQPPAAMSDMAANTPPEMLSTLNRDAAPRWPAALHATGKRGDDKDFLTVDTLTMPYDNPWRALMFASGVDFGPDGAAYVSTIHGDVWRVTGIDHDLKDIQWRRFATGLFQPLGLKVCDGKVFVLGRDRITRLHDLNHDGEADFYESFCDSIQTSTGGHDYVTSLEKDSAGRFYYVDPRGVHRVSADGSKMETLATGFRNPNGMGVNDDGTIVTVAPQQGEWTPSSVVVEVRNGSYYGFPGPKATPERPNGYDAPLCYIPHSVDNSSGGQAWTPSGHWGPLGGQIIHLLWGRATAMLLLRDTGSGIPQGATVPLPVRFLSGPDRAVFHKEDDSLYVVGSTGWQTSALKDGCFQRVRYTGRTVKTPIRWRARPTGIELEFATPLDPVTASDKGSYSVKQWNYRYAAEYGSKDWSVAHPGSTGHDEVAVTNAILKPDGRTVLIETSLQPVMQVEIQYNIDTTDHQTLRGPLWLTLNNPFPKN